MSDEDSAEEQIPDRVSLSRRAPEASITPPQTLTTPPQTLTAPPQTSAVNTKDNANDIRRKELIERFSQYYEINPKLASRMQILGDYDLVILCDDSGSMNTPIHGTTTNRWDECRQLVHVIVDVYAAFDTNGVDVYFLNRQPMLKVTDTKKVHELFEKPPNGLTPMVPALRAILKEKNMDNTANRNVLILIVTDGVPTDPKGEVNVDELEKIMRTERSPTTYVTFIACTDDLEALEYLNNWDCTMDRVDVVDDFRSELAQVREKRGPNTKFTYGDYLIKALIGSIDTNSMDALDE
ncbi:unnamed protein product [Adineta steineri]|uniref:VWFA domain-containing protein n=1 Tax=Adineta steineri TaxID=433720 RepID=A0A814N6J1_9BILA|nr:unnamed protein product [Adineta steineri]CAF1088544.1 unnamed protein product [Adineta steineri]